VAPGLIEVDLDVELELTGVTKAQWMLKEADYTREFWNAMKGMFGVGSNIGSLALKKIVVTDLPATPARRKMRGLHRFLSSAGVSVWCEVGGSVIGADDVVSIVR
jgi:hypothetical protein